MNRITTNQIETILDDYLNRYLNEEFAFKNVIFLGEITGRTTVIKRWMEKHSDILNITWGINAAKLHHRINGCYVPMCTNGVYQYCFETSFYQSMEESNSVLHYDRFNSSCTAETMDLLSSLITKRQYVDPKGDVQVLDNLFLFIAEVYPNNECHPHLTNIPGAILNHCDIYEVVPSVDEFRKVFLEKLHNCLKTAIELSDEEDITKCRSNLKLWTYILESDDFQFFFDKQDYFSTYDPFKLVRSSYNKNSLLKKVSTQCGEKTLAMFHKILKDYID